MNSSPTNIKPLSRRTISVNLLLLLLGGGGVQLFNAISMLIIARALGTTEYGLYVASFALVRVLSVFYNLGIDTYLLRKGQLLSHKLGSLILSTLVLKIGSGFIWIGLLFVLHLMLDDAIYPTIVFFAAAISIVFDGLFASILALLKSNLDNFITFVFSTIFSLTFFVGTLSLLDRNITEAEPYVFLRLLTSLIISAALWMVVAKKYDLKLEFNIIKDIFSNIRYYAFSDGLAVIYQSVDIVIITYMIGSQMAGIYSPAILILGALYIIPQALMNLTVPILSRLINDNNLSKNEIGKTLAAFGTTGGLLWIVTSLLGRPLISMALGEQYAQTGEVLTILAPIIFLKSISFAFASIIIGADLQKKRVTCQLISAISNIILNLLVVKQFGINGVATVFVFSELMLVIGYFFIVQKWFIHFQKIPFQ